MNEGPFDKPKPKKILSIVRRPGRENNPSDNISMSSINSFGSYKRPISANINNRDKQSAPKWKL
jgi:hypothetical protein